MSEHPPTDNQITERLNVSETAARLGITESAVRGRINRNTLRAERVEGTVYVLLSAEQLADSQQLAGDYSGEYNALTSALEARIESLERQLEEARDRERQANERDRENRRLLAAALERIPPQLESPSEEAPSEAREAPVPNAEGDSTSEAPEERPRPWWRRIFEA